MNIWILTSELPPEITGGIGRYVINFSTHLCSEGHNVTIFARGTQDSMFQLSCGATVISFKPAYDSLGNNQFSRCDSHPGFPFNIMGYECALAYQFSQVVKQFLKNMSPPDIIECQEYLAVGYFLMQEKLLGEDSLSSIPIVCHLHSPDFVVRQVNEEPTHLLPFYWLGRMERYCILAADSILAPSQYLASQIREIMPEVGNISVIPLPVSEKRELVFQDFLHERIIVYPGRLELRKGVIPLLEACVHLWDEGFSFTLKLIGGSCFYMPKGVSVDAFIRRKYRRWLDRGFLVLCGNMDFKSLENEMRSATAVVIPSLWENFPNTCVESMLAGCVVLASKSGGQAEMITEDAVDGFLFDWEIEGDFERQIKKIFNLSHEELRSVGLAAHNRISDFCNPEDIVEKRVEHFQSVIENSKRNIRETFPVTWSLPFSREQKAPKSNHDREISLIPGLISVIIPFFNLGSYLYDAIDSVQASDYKNWEIIVVDDGSDEIYSLEVLEKLKKQDDSRVKVFQKKNEGLPLTRNYGASKATGEFLIFLDADDMLTPTFLSRSIQILERWKNVTFVYSWVRYFEGSSEVWVTWNIDLPYMLCHNMLTPMAVVRTDFFLRYGKNDPLFKYNFEDYESWVNMVANGAIGVSIPEALVRYRVRSGSMWQSGGRKQLQYLNELLVKKHPHLFKAYGDEIFNLQNQNGPGYTWTSPSSQTSFDYSEYSKENCVASAVGEVSKKFKFAKRLRKLIRL